MEFLQVLLVVFSMLALVTTARAETLFEKYGKLITDDVVLAYRSRALKKLYVAPCAPDEPCVSSKQDGKQIGEYEPLISLQAGRTAMAHGIVSALAEWCNLDWKRSFLPMLAEGRTKQKMDDRPLMVMALMHSDFQGSQLAFYRKEGACTEQIRAELDTLLPKI